MTLRVQLSYCSNITIALLFEVWFFNIYSCVVSVSTLSLKRDKSLFIDYYLLFSSLDFVYKYYFSNNCNSSFFIILSRQKVNYQEDLTSFVHYRSIDLLTWNCQSEFLYKYSIFAWSMFDQHSIFDTILKYWIFCQYYI